MPVQIGQVLNNRYRIVQLLGKGGMGAVYRAWDLSFSRPCAVKENEDTSESSIEQFEREAKILNILRHQNLPKVFDYFTIPGQGVYLAMDYIEGEDLGSKLEAYPSGLPLDKTLGYIYQVCDALSYLHRQDQKIIHRDIKPANIRITPKDEAVLVDFGIAKVFDPNFETFAGAKFVTLEYAPPEQFGPEKTDQRSDIYSLGATAYHLLTGRVPPVSIHISAGAESLTPIQQVNPSIPAHVSLAIEKAMQIKMDDRFSRVEDFAEALRGNLPLKPIDEQIPSKPRRNYYFWIPFSISILIFFFAGVWLVNNYIINKTTPPPSETESTLSSEFQTILSESSSPSPTPTFTTTSTFTLTPTFSPTPTDSPTPTIENIPITPTFSLPVNIETPMPLIEQVINPETISELSPIAEWGKGPVSHVAVSSNGQMVAVASLFRVDFYNPETYAPWGHILSLQEITSMAVSHDGDYFAIGHPDGNIEIWESNDGGQTSTQLFILQEQTERINSLTFTSDDALIASGSEDNSAIVWNVANGSLEHRFRGQLEGVTCVAFSPDSTTLAAGSKDDTIWIWRLSDEAVIIRDLKASSPNDITGLTYSPEGDWLAFGSNGNALLYRVIDWQMMQLIPKAAYHLKFSPDGRFFTAFGWNTRYVTEADKIRVWEVVTDGVDLESEHVLLGHHGDIAGLAFSADSQSIISGGTDNTIRIWNAVDGRLEQSIDDHFLIILDAAISPDGKYVAITTDKPVVQIWDLNNGGLIHEITGNPSAEGVNTAYESIPRLRFSPDGKLIGVLSNDLTLYWTTDWGSIYWNFRNFGSYTFAFSSNNKYVAVGLYDGAVDVYYLSDGTKIDLIDGGLGQFSSLAFSPDDTSPEDTTVIASNRSYRTRHYLVSTGIFLGQIRDVLGRVYNLEYSPDGGVIAANENPPDNWYLTFRNASDPNLMLLIPEIPAAEDYDPPREMPTDEYYYVAPLRYSPDNRLLVEGAYLWSVVAGLPQSDQPIMRLPDIGQKVEKIDFSSDGRLLLTLLSDRTIRIWGIP